jgi:hypothetical protein
MAEDKAKTSTEGLSLQTLVVAAVASGIAAVVVSRVWKDGTVFAAAMTPVVVSIVKELLQRPMQSEAVRRSASRVSSVAVAPARRVVTTTGATRSRSGTRAYEPPPREAPPRETRSGNGNGNANGAPPTGEVLHSGPRRTYGSDGRERRRLHRLSPKQLRLAIVTGVLAFVVAVAALTIPELIFGGAVSSGHRTTIFGGGSSSSSDKNDKNKDDQSNPSGNGDQQQDPTQPKDPNTTNPQTTQPQTQTQPPDTQTQTEPDTQQPPSQTQPPPDSGGGTTQPSPQTPVPSPPAP